MNQKDVILSRFNTYHWVLLLVVAASLTFARFAWAQDAHDAKWPLLKIVHVLEVPLDASPRFGAASRTFFTSEKGALIYAVWQPTWNSAMPTVGLGSHYHLWHEWAYMLDGDLIIQEPVSPYQRNGAMYRYVQGTWLDRPAYTLHGGGWATGGLRSQNPVTLILFEEGDGSVITVGPDGDHFKPDFPDKPIPYEPDWRSVKHFQRPWIVNSGSDLEWEDDPEISGRLLKWLSDDMNAGFRARLIKIPPGWTSPDGVTKSRFQHAHRLRYMLHGDMTVWQFDEPTAEGSPVKVSKDFFVHQPPGSIWGYGSGSVTERGAIWLEVTYAKGLEVGGGPIEKEIQIE